MSTIHQTIIRFPEIKLSPRDGHKLRGYFGNLFKERSPLLHNHLQTGEHAYQYPLVQYKVLNGIPTLVGLQEGAELLINLFLKMQELEINGRRYPVTQKNIESTSVQIGLSQDLGGYTFETLWMALNQQNHQHYTELDLESRKRQLKAVLIGNILSFYKAMGFRAQERILVNLQITAEKETQFKNRTMLAFDGNFVTNALLPPCIGLGKSVARGFGTITLS